MSLLRILLLSLLCFKAFTAAASAPGLPKSTLDSLLLYSDYADVIYYPPSTSTLSMEGPNVKFLNQFVGEPVAEMPKTKAAGFVMWLIKGKEFLRGDFYLSTNPQEPASWVFKQANATYIHRLTDNGKSFFQQYFK